MATSGMTSGKVVGIVKGVEGVVTAINDRGVIRTLKAGDKVFAGETIQTADGANAHIDFSRGGFATMGAGQSLPMDGTVLSQAAEAAKTKPDQPQNGTSDADVEKLQQQIEEALAKGEDPTQLLEAAAAGPGSGSGGGQEGSDFVLVEQLAARGNVTPGFDTGTFGVEFKDPYEYDGRELPGGTFDFNINTDLPGGDPAFVPYVYEDWQPNRWQGTAADPDLGDRTPHPGQILFSFVGTGTTVVTNIHLTGFTPGSELHKLDPVTGTTSVITPNPDGSYDLTVQDFNDGIFVKPPLNDDADMDIHAVLSLQTNSGATGTISGDFVIQVDAVADRPENVEGNGAVEVIDGALVIDGLQIEEKLADGWAKTEIDKDAATVTDDAVTIEGYITVNATFFDRADGSEVHTLYIEKPAAGEGKLGYWAAGNVFVEFDTIDINGKTFYQIPEFDVNGDPVLDANGDPIVQWTDMGTTEPGQWDAEANCVYQADGSVDSLNGDISLDLQVIARAEDNGSEPDVDASNNIAWNQSDSLEGTNVQFIVDSVDSTLTIKTGWASEDNAPGKHLSSSGSYAPDYANMAGDKDAGGERGDLSGDNVHSNSTAGANGAPIVVSIDNPDPDGTNEVVTKVVFKDMTGSDTLQDGTWMVSGNPLTAGNNFVGTVNYHVGADGTLTVTDSSGNLGSGIDLTAGLTFQPAPTQSDVDLKFQYEVSVRADSTGAEAIYKGTSLIVVDAVADRPTDVRIAAEKVAGAGEEIDLTVNVKFNDLGAGEHKYIVLNLKHALDNGWELDSGINVLTKSQATGAFQAQGGADLPVDNVLFPVGDATAQAEPQYVLLEVIGDGAGGWVVHGVDAAGNNYPLTNVTVTETGSGQFTVEMKDFVKAPDADGSSQIWVKPVTVVDKDSLGGEEYDYDNNISVGDAPTIPLQVSGVHSTLEITPTAVYEGSQADKNTGDMSVSAGGKIALSLASDGTTNTNPDALGKMVFQYDSTHGKIFLGNIAIESGYAIVFTYNAATDLYTNAVVVDAAGNTVGSVNVPGQSLELITGGLKYTPTTGDVSDVDVDIDYLATIIDPTSGATKVIASDGFNINASGNTTVADIEAIDPSNKTETGGSTASVVVDAVADKSLVNGSNTPDYGTNEGGSANTAAGNGDTVKITTTEVTFKDYADSSENHYLLIGSKDVALGTGTADLALPDQTIILKGPGGTPTLEIKIEGGKVVSIDGETLDVPINVNVGAITDPNAGTGLGGYDFIKIPVPNEFLETTGGKITADIDLKLPEGITTDQTIDLKVGGMAEETETNVPADEIRTDNNTSYTFQDGSIAINVSNSITARATAGYEDGWSNQNTVSPASPTGPSNAVITIAANGSDHIQGTKTGETGEPIVLEFRFAGGDSNLGTFTYGSNTYSLGDGHLVKVSDGSYKLTIPAADLPQSATGADKADITYKPVGNDDHDLTSVKVTMVTHADTSTDSATQTATIGTVVIDAVADLPVSDVPDVATYGANTAAEIGKEFQITINDVQFQDYADGSEMHALLIQQTGITGGVALADLGDQVITINGGNGTSQIITIAGGVMTIEFGGVTYSSSNLPSGWSGADWTAAETALINGGKLVNTTDTVNDYFKIPVLNEFLSAADGKVTNATVDVKLPAGTNINRDVELTVKTGAMADDKATDSDSVTTNNQAYALEDTKVNVGVVTSEPKVAITDNVVSENQRPNANTGDEATEDSASIVISDLHSGETATVTLTFDLKAAGNIPESVKAGDEMRVTYDDTDYVASKNLDGSWSCTVVVTGDSSGNATLTFLPGYNYNSQDIGVKYEITIKDDASGAEKTWQNGDSTGASGTYQNNGLGIVVDSVAQLPNIVNNKVYIDGLKDGYTHVEKGEPVVLSGKMTFYDAADGSELHYVVVEVNEKVGQLTSITIDGQLVALSGDMLWKHDGKMFYKIPVDGPGGGATQYDVEVVAKYTPGSSSVDGETVRLGGVSAEDHTKFNHGDNKELTEENNTAVNYIKSAEIYFSNIGGVATGGGVLYEADNKDAHVGDQNPEGGTTITLTEAGNAEITKVVYEYDEARGDLYLDGVKVDNVAGITVDRTAGKVTVTISDPTLIDKITGGKLNFTPDANNHSDVDIKLGCKVDYTNTETGKVVTGADKTISLQVDAVAQKPVDPEGESQQQAAINHGDSIDIELSAKFDDFDGSESHYILVEAQPNTSLSVNGVAITETFTHEGVVYYKVPVTPDSAGVGEVTVSYTTSGNWKVPTTDIKYGALAEDKASDGEYTVHNNVGVAVADGDIDVNYKPGGGPDEFYIGSAYENNTPTAHKDVPAAKAGVDVDMSQAPAGAEKVIVTVDPAQGYLTDAAGNALTPTDPATGTYTIDKADFGNVKFWVKEDSTDDDITVSYEYQNAGGSTITSGQELVIVDAVAQKPVNVDGAVETGGVAAFKPTDTVDISVSATFKDYTDGSESHYVLVEQVPGVTVKSADGAVTYSDTVFLDGKSYVKVPVDNSDIAAGGGDIKVDLQLELGSGFKGSANFTQNANGSYDVKLETGALAVETDAGGKNVFTGGPGNFEADIGNNMAWTKGDELVVKVSGVDSNITVGVNPAYEGGAHSDTGAGTINVNGLASGKEDVMTEFKLTYDSSEGVVTLNGAQITAGAGIVVSDDGAGNITITFTDPTAIAAINANGLKYIPSGTGDTDTSIAWSATVKDNLSGEIKTFGDSSAKVVVDAVANAPTVGTAGFDAAGNTAMKGGGTGEVSVKLTFSDTDSSETHYAILQQSSDIICTGATVNNVPITTGVETFVGDDGKPYYAVRIPDGVANADVVFTIQAKDVDADVQNKLNVGGVSLEENVGLGADKEITLGNNIEIKLADNPVEIRIGTVTTEKVDLAADGNLIEGNATTEVTLELNATGGVNEKITSVDLVFEQVGTDDLADGTVIGSVWYDGVKVQDITAGDINNKTAITVYDAAGIDSDAVTVKLDPGYHNSNSLTVKSDATVTDESGETKSGLTGSATVLISATADKATGVTAVDGADAGVVAGHATEVTVDLGATFVDVDGSENHYFYVKVAADVVVSEGSLVTDTSKLTAAGFAATDRVYMVDVADDVAVVDKTITLKVPGSTSNSTSITVVAVSDEGTVGTGGTQYAYSDKTTISVDVIANPNINGVVDPAKAAADVLDTARGNVDVDGTLLPAGYVTDKDGDAITIASVTGGTGSAATGWTVTGTYGTWTVKADGTYTYELSAASKLNPPVNQAETLSFTVTDGKGWTSAVLSNTLNLKADTNKAPTAPAASLSAPIAETLTGTFKFSDLNKDLVNLTAMLCGGVAGSWNGDLYTVAGEYGTLVVDKGTATQSGNDTVYSYEYSPNEAGLVAGVTDSFIFQGEDAYGGSVTNGSLDITLAAVDYDLSSGASPYDGDGIFGWDAGANIHGSLSDGEIGAGTGDDTISVTGDGNTIHGGDGDDIIMVSGDDNIIFGDAGNDIINVSGNDNVIYGGTGSDTITITGSGDNTVYGGAGDDVIDISGNTGSTTIKYTTGDLDSVVAGDSIKGFKVGADGDVLDISDLLTGAGLGDNSAALKDGGFLTFESITQTADGKTTVTFGIDVDGSAGAGTSVNLGTVVMDGVGPLGTDQAQALFDQLMANDQIKF